MTTNIGVIAEDEHGRPYGVLFSDSQRSHIEDDEVKSAEFDSRKIRHPPKSDYAYSSAGLALNLDLNWKKTIIDAYSFIKNPNNLTKLHSQLEQGHLSQMVHLNNLTQEHHKRSMQFLLLTNKQKLSLYKITNGPVKDVLTATSGFGEKAAAEVLYSHIAKKYSTIISLHDLLNVGYEAMNNAATTCSTGGHVDIAIVTPESIYTFREVYGIQEQQQFKDVAKLVELLNKPATIDTTPIISFDTVTEPHTVLDVLPTLNPMYQNEALRVLLNYGEPNQLITALPHFEEDYHNSILTTLSHHRPKPTLLRPLLAQKLPENTLCCIEDMCQ